MNALARSAVVSAAIAFVLSGSMPTVATAASTPAAVEVSAFTHARLKHSAVAVLLPARLPPTFGPVRSVALLFADRNGYYVGYSTVAHCGGALSCAKVHVSGYLLDSRAGRAYRTGTLVRLPAQARGYFTSRDCRGAGCTQATLIFVRANTVYEIDAAVMRNDLSTLLAIYRELRYVH